MTCPDRPVHGDDALATYRYLRISLVAVVIFLATSLTGTWHATGTLQGSISAFYFTTTHAAFIGALCAVGIGLVVYKGNTAVEDVLLNSAGFLAFVVALVPTKSPDCSGPPQQCGLWLPDFADHTSAVGNNIAALLIATLSGVVIYFAVAQVHPPASPGYWAPDELSRWVVWIARALQVAYLVVGIAVLVVSPETFYGWAHNVSATAMFGCIILVVALYARYAKTRARETNTPSRFGAWYSWIGRAMTAMLVVAVILHFVLPGQWVFWVEAALIALFAAFWLIQTLDLWAKEDKYCPARA